MKTIIGKFKMLPLEDGLSANEIIKLVSDMTHEELIPITNLNSNLTSNSAAMGFLSNDYEGHWDDVIEKLTEVCNDWDLETEDGLYCINESDKLYIHLDSNEHIYLSKENEEFSVTFTVEDMLDE